MNLTIIFLDIFHRYVSVFRWNLLSLAQSTQIVLVSGDRTMHNV
jgi:hypothetical protein